MKHKQVTLEAEPPALAKKFKLGQAQKMAAKRSKGKATIVVEDDPPTNPDV